MRALGRGFESLRFALAGNLVGRVLRIGLTFMSAIVLARLLGPVGFGLAAVLLSLVRLASIPVLEGVAKLAERELAGAIGRESKTGAWAAARFAALGTLCVGALALLLVAVLLMQYLPATAENGLSDTVLATLALLAVTLLVSAFKGLVRGEGQTVKALIPALAAQALAPLFYWVWHTSIHPLTVDAVLWLQAAAHGVVLPIWVWIAWRSRPKTMKDDGGRTPSQTRWFAESFQFTLLGIVTIALMEIGVVMLGMMGHPEEAGYLRIANRVYLIATFVTIGAGQAVGPRIAYLWQSGGRDALERPSRLISLLALSLALVAFAVVGLVGQDLLALLFGDPFRAAFVPSLILAAAAVVQSAGAISGRLLKMTGNQVTVTLGSLAGLLIAVLGNLALIPSYGATGAAVALFGGIVISRVILNLGVYRIIGFNPLPGALAVRDLLALRWRVRSSG